VETPGVATRDTLVKARFVSARAQLRKALGRPMTAAQREDLAGERQLLEDVQMELALASSIAFLELAAEEMEEARENVADALGTTVHRVPPALPRRPPVRGNRPRSSPRPRSRRVRSTRRRICASRAGPARDDPEEPAPGDAARLPDALLEWAKAHTLTQGRFAQFTAGELEDLGPRGLLCLDEISVTNGSAADRVAARLILGARGDCPHEISCMCEVELARALEARDR
jgi:hypothetical protein